MISGKKEMGMHKHGTSGVSPKSPKLRHAIKLAAERDVRKDTKRIKDPKTSIADLFRRR